MRIAHVFNLANDAWALCKGLRKLGVKADLFVHRPDHVCNLPQWEEADVDLGKVGSLHDPNWEALMTNWRMPPWVRVCDIRAKRWRQFGGMYSELLDFLEDYDLVVGHTPFASLALPYWLRYRRSFVLYDAGWIRILHENRTGYASGRWGYRHASRIFFTNVDTLPMFEEHGYRPERLDYVPFAIDTDKYRPSPVEASPYGDRNPIFLSPTRQDWAEKGNDRLLLAFARYLKRKPDALLLLVEWADSPHDLLNTKQLVSELGIQSSVRWLPVVNKMRLVRLYNLSTAVFDQFVFGAFGTTVPEAMACAKPVVGYAESSNWKHLHGSVPPVLNCRTAEEIYWRMVELEEPALREKIGLAARAWVEKTCSLEKVANAQIASYEEILAGR